MLIIEELEKLREENERLKKEIKINLQRTNALNRELNQLQTCLQEIKEIAETCMSQELCTFCKYSDDCLISCTDYDNNKLVLQKIAECEV